MAWGLFFFGDDIDYLKESSEREKCSIMLKVFQLSFRFLKSQKFASLSRKTGSNIFVFHSGRLKNTRSFFLDFFFIFDFSGALPYSDTSQV